MNPINQSFPIIQTTNEYIAYQDIPYEGPLTREEVPFNQPFTLSEERVQQLWIRANGISELPEFSDSIFATRYKHGQFVVIRQLFQERVVDLSTFNHAYAPTGLLQERTINLSTFNNEETLPFVLCNPKIEKHWNNNSTLMRGMAELPDEILGAGFMGQIYRVNADLVIKIERNALGIRINQIFYPVRLADTTLRSIDSEVTQGVGSTCFISAVDEGKMIASFQEAMKTARRHGKLPPSPHYAKGEGIVYIKELNIWGTVMEFIPGSELPLLFESPLKAINVVQSVLLGLKELDAAGHPYLGLKPENIIVREDGTAVLFDGITDNDPSLETSKQSRQEFGTLLHNALVEEVSSQFPFQAEPSKEWRPRKELTEKFGPLLPKLIMDCWSDMSIEKFSWEKIESQLRLLHRITSYALRRRLDQ